MNKPLPTGMVPDTLVDLHETAAEWLVRRQEPGWTGADEHALDAWLQADPFHREVFDSMDHTRQLFGQLKQYRAERQAAAQAAPVPAARTRLTFAAPEVPRRARWWVVARSPAFACILAGVLVLALGGGWYAWDNTARYSLDVATARGEVRDIALPDGSHIALNWNSTLQVRYYPRRREVVLNQGEAFFQVSADAARPFTVDSGRSQVKVVGTAFNVRAAPPRLIVKVREGQVEVRPDRTVPDGPVLVLGPASGVSVDPETAQHVPVHASSDTVGDWRNGQLRFKRSPLGEVVQDVARYLGRPVSLAGPELFDLPVSAYFSTAAPDAFMELLPDIAPVRVRRQPDGGWMISHR